MARTQPLAFPIRLPDALQAEALRLLDASRAAINQLLVDPWPDLDRFAAERTGPAWKQVERYAARRSGHGSRQERCEMEQAGRILRSQASRKQVFQTILPLLSAGLIRPAEGKRPAKKDERQIRAVVRALRAEQQEAGEEASAFVAMTNLIEQACNCYLQTGAFPATYEEVQAVPVQKVGQLTFAGDDGMHAGQTYRALLWVAQSCDLSTRAEERHASFLLRLRAPDPRGTWVWGAWSAAIPLPATVCASLEHGATPLAPTLREIVRPDGRRVAVLDLILEVPTRQIPPRASERRVLGFDWGVRSLITASVVEKSPGRRYSQVSRPVFLDTGGIDGRQARLRREIDRLKACREHYAALCQEALAALAEQQPPLPADFPRWQARVRDYEERISACWQKYARRNRELAHLAAKRLDLLALLADCHLICGENLATLRTEGRGRGVRGRWRNWRNNTTVRGELWQVLSYKCRLLGIRARQVEPRGTTHTCPHCHQQARTFASPAPADRKQALDWGPWLCCENPECRWNGARDYAASLNIARLGLALFLIAHRKTPSQTSTMTKEEMRAFRNPVFRSKWAVSTSLSHHYRRFSLFIAGAEKHSNDGADAEKRRNGELRNALKRWKKGVLYANLFVLLAQKPAVSETSANTTNGTMNTTRRGTLGLMKPLCSLIDTLPFSVSVFSSGPPDTWSASLPHPTLLPVEAGRLPGIPLFKHGASNAAPISQ